MPLKLGDSLLDIYRITASLGQGAFGRTYLAEHQHLGDKRVIKQLLSEHLGDDEARQRFVNEARTMSLLKDPHVVTVHDLFTPAQFKLRDYFIVMEYMSGGSLKDYLDEQGALPVQTAVRLTIDVLHGLQRAHRQNIVHRDIKPANVLLDEGARLAKVGDWGLVHLPDITLTIGGQPGTIVYMSVEQAEGRATIDGRSDLYSVGAMLYEMVAGPQHYYLDFNRIMRQARAAFLQKQGVTAGQELRLELRPALEGATYRAMYRAIVEQAPDPLVREDDSLVEPLKPVIAKALSKDPGDRFATPEQMIEALQEVLRPAAPRAVPVEPSVETETGSTSVGALVERARTATKEHHYEEAVRLLKQAKALSPRRVRIHAQLAAVFNLMGQETDACQVLEEAASLAPDDPSLLRALGMTHHKMGNARKAIDALERFLALHSQGNARDPKDSAIQAMVLKLREQVAGAAPRAEAQAPADASPSPGAPAAVQPAAWAAVAQWRPGQDN